MFFGRILKTRENLTYPGVVQGLTLFVVAILHVLKLFLFLLQKLLKCINLLVICIEFFVTGHLLKRFRRLFFFIRIPEKFLFQFLYGNRLFFRLRLHRGSFIILAAGIVSSFDDTVPVKINILGFPWLRRRKSFKIPIKVHRFSFWFRRLRCFGIL